MLIIILSYIPEWSQVNMYQFTSSQLSWFEERFDLFQFALEQEE